MKVLTTGSPQETQDAGKAFGAGLKPGDVVALFGTLGTGKTVFVAGVCEGLGVRVHATSPTFTLINEYPAPFGVVAHIDLYRISMDQELDDLGVESYFHDAGVCLIEWAERAVRILPPGYRSVKLSHGGSPGERRIEIFSGRDVRV
jgi:tRNA threonylcarbamoyladenosine biosynthesis protein TsaE